MHRPAALPAAVLRAVGVAVSLLLSMLVLLPGTAAADVTVTASRAEAGARDVTITFRVANDDPAVPISRVQVFLPSARPLLGVVPTAPTGWNARVDEAPPPEPVTVDGAPLATIVTAVTWDGGPVAGSDYVVFPIDVARLPDGAGPLRFRVVQTDVRGARVEYSDLLPTGAPAPAHPALVVPYTRPGAPAAAPAPAAASGHHHGDDPGNLAVSARAGSAGRTVGIAALFALVVAVWVTALGRRQRRRMAALQGDRPRPPAEHGSRAR